MGFLDTRLWDKHLRSEGDYNMGAGVLEEGVLESLGLMGFL